MALDILCDADIWDTAKWDQGKNYQNLVKVIQVSNVELKVEPNGYRCLHPAGLKCSTLFPLPHNLLKDLWILTLPLGAPETALRLQRCREVASQLSSTSLKMTNCNYQMVGQLHWNKSPPLSSTTTGLIHPQNYHPNSSALRSHSNTMTVLPPGPG